MRSAHPRPLVSFVIGTRGPSEELRRAVESVLAQSYENVELIVVNDGGSSMESLLAPLDRRGRMLQLRLPQRRGFGYARNHGLRLARGEYVGLLDETATLDVHHTETLSDALRHTNYVIARALVRRRIETQIDGVAEVLSESSPWPARPRPPTLRELVSENAIALSSVLLHRRCFEEHGAFDDSLPAFEDWDLWLRIARKHEILAVDSVTSTIYQSAHSPHGAHVRARLKAAQTIRTRNADLVAHDPELRAAQARVIAALEREASKSTARVSVVVPFRSEHPGYVRGFLEQLARTSRPIDIELLVLDRGLSPSAASEAAALADRVHRDVGALGPALDDLCAKATCDALVFLRSDVILEEGWLERLEQAANGSGDIVCGMTLDSRGRVAHVGLAFEGEEATCRPVFFEREATSTELDLVDRLDATASAVLWMPTELVRRLGVPPLDDWDAVAALTMRAQAGGTPIRFSPSSVVYRVPRSEVRPWLARDERDRLAAMARGEPVESGAVESAPGVPESEPSPRAAPPPGSEHPTSGGRSPVVAA